MADSANGAATKQPGEEKPSAGSGQSSQNEGGTAGNSTTTNDVKGSSNASANITQSSVTAADKPASNEASGVDSAPSAASPSVQVQQSSSKATAPQPAPRQQQQTRPNGGYWGNSGASLLASSNNSNVATPTSLSSGPPPSGYAARSPQPPYNSGTTGGRSPIPRPPSIDQQLAASFPPPGHGSGASPSSSSATNSAQTNARDSAASSASASASTQSNNTSSNPIAAGFLGSGQRGLTSLNAPSQPSSATGNATNLQSRTGSSSIPLFPPPSIVSRTSGQQFPPGTSPPVSSTNTPTGNASPAGGNTSAAMQNRTASPFGSNTAASKPGSGGQSGPMRQQNNPSHFSRFQYPSAAVSAGRTASPTNGTASIAGAAAKDPRNSNPAADRNMSNSPVNAAPNAPGSGPAASGGTSLNASAASTAAAASAQQQQQRDQSRTGSVASSLGPGFMERPTTNSSGTGQAAWRSVLDRPTASQSAAQQQAEQAKKRRTNSTSATSSPFTGYGSGYGGNLPTKSGTGSGAGGAGTASSASTAANNASQPPRSVTASPSAPASASSNNPQRSHVQTSRVGYPMTLAERLEQNRAQEQYRQQSKEASSTRPGSQASPPLSSQATGSRLPSYFNAPSANASTVNGGKGTPTAKSASPPPNASGSASTPGAGNNGSSQAQAPRPGSPPRRTNPYNYGFGVQQQQRLSGAADGGRASPGQHGQGSHQHSASTSNLPGSAGLHQGQSGNGPSQAQQQAHYRRVSMGASSGSQQGQTPTSAQSQQFQSSLFRPPHAGHSRTGSLTSAQAIGQSLSNSSAQSPSSAMTPVSRTGNTGGIGLASQTDVAAAANAAWRAIPSFHAQQQATREAQNQAALQARMDAQKKSEMSMSPRLQQGQQQSPANSSGQGQGRTGADLQNAQQQQQQAAYELQQANLKRKRSELPDQGPASAGHPQSQQQQQMLAHSQAQARGQQGIPHPQQQQPPQAASPAATLQSHRGTKGSLFSAEDIKGAALRPPLMAVRSDLVVRALHKIASQQSQDPTVAPVPPFLGRVIYDPFLDPADLLDAELLRQGVGGKVEIWLDTEWLQGEIWEAGAPSNPATSVPPSPDGSDASPTDMLTVDGADKGKGRDLELAIEEPMMDIDGNPLLQQRRPSKQPEDASPNWTLWDLLPLRNRKIWGTDVYTDDSDILAACIHSGWLRLGSTAPLFGTPQAESVHKRKRRRKTLKHRSLRITIVIAPKLIKYEGSLRAGVRSRSWGNSHDGVSYAIESVELVENAVHRLPHSRLKRNVSAFLPLAKERCACSAGCDQSHRPPAYNRSIAIGKALIKAA